MVFSPIFLYNVPMNHPLLNSPDEFPSNIVLARYLGSCFSSWSALVKLLEESFPGMAMEWRYHEEGKSWQCNVAHKSRTLCWVSVWDRFFKAGFLFTARAEDAIRNSALAPALKESFLHPSGRGRLRPITIYVRKKADLAAVGELLAVKVRVR